MIRELTAYVHIQADQAKQLKRDAEFLNHIQALLAERIAVSITEFAELQTVETVEGLGIFTRVYISNDELIELADTPQPQRVSH